MQLNEELAERLLLACSDLTRTATAAASGTRLSLTQARVLGALHRSGPLRVSRLAELERCAQPSMTGLLGRLEDAGYVERAPDPADARAVLAHLTPAGEDELLRNRRRLREPLARALRETATDDVERLIGLLENTTRALHPVER
ncbi:MarR family winged helix-turn-helix transcriptional regulator [Kineococcus sp. SYSU DK003]|uniref:MarR family winged helix-turn-helix transcriptional regulator n=1 Tax=Kineococcus sp. SYSU DK003 TaxID=3383124 RepID=UPI003D7DC608